MLLQSFSPVEKRCPALWTLAAAGSLLALAVLAAGIGIRAEAADKDGKDQAAPREIDPADVQNRIQQAQDVIRRSQEQQQRATEEMRKLVEQMQHSPENQAQIQQQMQQIRQAMGRAREQQQKATDEIQRIMDQVQRMQGGQWQFPGGQPFPGGNPQLPPQIIGGPGGFPSLMIQTGRHEEARLGVRVDKPTDVLADQLDLPKGQGLIIEHVQPDSPAAKAGLKVNDVLLEVNGKAVASEPRELGKLIGDIKADAAVELAVKRKGKKETIKIAALPEAKPPHLLGQISTFTSFSRSGDQVTVRHNDGRLSIGITGTVADGKLKVRSIDIGDTSGVHKYESVDDVPEKLRDKVKKLIDMSDKVPVSFRDRDYPKAISGLESAP